MAKPFQIEEVLARLRALIRRASSGHAGAAVRSGGAGPARRRVTVQGMPVKLPAMIPLLSYLMHHRAASCRGELTEHIYSQGFDRDSNTVEVFARLRRKLGGTFIETVRGMGYRIEAQP